MGTATKSDGTISTHQVAIPIVITAPPTITLSSPSPSPVIVSSNQTVKFMVTVSAVNGMTGIIGFTIPPNYQACWGGQVTSLTPQSANLTAANPTQTLTGTIAAGSNLGNSPAVYGCPIEAVNGILGYDGTLTLQVPVLVTAGSTFTVTGPTAPITLYANSTATPVNLQINPVNGFTGNVTFTTTTPNVTVQGSTVYVSGAQTPAPINVQWASSTLPTPNPIPITILANGQAVLTIGANVLSNPGTSFTLTSSPASQTANSSGAATIQINVNASSAFTGCVSYALDQIGQKHYAPAAEIVVRYVDYKIRDLSHEQNFRAKYGLGRSDGVLPAPDAIFGVGRPATPTS